MPAHHERLNPFSTAGPAGANFLLDSQPSRTTQLDSLPSSISAHLEDCGKPTAVLGSRPRNKGIDSKASTSSSRTALGSLPSRLRTFADQGTSMQARRRQRDLVPQLSNGNVTGARSDLVPKAFLSSSDDVPITMSRSSRPPLSQISNRADVSLARKDSKTQAVNRIPKSIPRRPPSHLVPELQDHAFFLSDEAFLDKDDPPCASGKARKGGRLNDYRISSRPCDTSSPDYSLPGDSGKHVRFRIITAFTNLDLGSL
jgi:hypothetical protein